MGVVARMKSLAGGITIPTLASAATLTLPQDTSRAFITGSTTITSLNATDIKPGRTFTFLRGPAATDIPVFTNTQGTTTAGQIDFNTNQSTIQLYDTLTLIQTNTGSWRKKDSTTV